MKTTKYSVSDGDVFVSTDVSEKVAEVVRVRNEGQMLPISLKTFSDGGQLISLEMHESKVNIFDVRPRNRTAFKKASLSVSSEELATFLDAVEEYRSATKKSKKTAK